MRDLRQGAAGSRMLFFWASMVFFWFSLYTYPVLLSDFARQELGATPAMAGAIIGSFGLTQLVLRIPLGFLSDSLRRRKPFLILGSVLTTLAAFGLWQAKTPLAAWFARSTAGMGASNWVAFSVLFASYEKRTNNIYAMGTLTACMYGAQLLASQCGGFVAQAVGTRGAFLLAIAVGAIGIITSTGVADVRPKKQSRTMRDMLAVIKNRMMLRCAGLAILMQFIVWSTLFGFSPQWAQTVLGADAAQLALLSTVQLLSTIIFSWAGSALLEPRFGANLVAALGFMCIAVSCLLMPFTAVFFQMLCLQFVSGIGVGCIHPLTMAFCIRDISPEQQGLGMGVFQSLYALGMSAGPILAGALIQWVSPVVDGVSQYVVGYRVNFGVMAAVGLLGALLAFLWMPRVAARRSKS